MTQEAETIELLTGPLLFDAHSDWLCVKDPSFGSYFFGNTSTLETQNMFCPVEGVRAEVSGFGVEQENFGDMIKLLLEKYPVG